MNEVLAGVGTSVDSELESTHPWICVAQLESRERSVIAMPPSVDGRWLLGVPGSGAAIAIAEPVLDKVELHVWAASNHLILEGRIPDGVVLPPLGISQGDKSGEWNWMDPMQWVWTLQEGRLQVRFDYHWLRIGEHAIRISWDRADLEEEQGRHQEPSRKPWWKRLFGGAS